MHNEKNDKGLFRLWADLIIKAPYNLTEAKVKYPNLCMHHNTPFKLTKLYSVIFKYNFPKSYNCNKNKQ